MNIPWKFLNDCAVKYREVRRFLFCLPLATHVHWVQWFYALLERRTNRKKNWKHIPPVLCCEDEPVFLRVKRWVCPKLCGFGSLCVCVCVCVDLLKRSKTCKVFDSRGIRLIIPTWRNEAMVWWGMGGLINHLYLLHGHDEGDVQTLVTRVSFLGFCFKLLVPTHWRWNMHHYHELGTERAISLIQVCILWWMSDKVPQGQGFDPEQPLSRG